MKLYCKLFILLVCVFISCKKRTTPLLQTNNAKETASGILHLDRYEINESGMKYVIYRESHGNLEIINITKDSLSVLDFQNKNLNQ